MAGRGGVGRGAHLSAAGRGAVLAPRTRQLVSCAALHCVAGHETHVIEALCFAECVVHGLLRIQACLTMSLRCCCSAPSGRAVFSLNPARPPCSAATHVVRRDGKSCQGHVCRSLETSRAGTGRTAVRGSPRPHAQRRFAPISEH